MSQILENIRFFSILGHLNIKYRLISVYGMYDLNALHIRVTFQHFNTGSGSMIIQKRLIPVQQSPEKYREY